MRTSFELKTTAFTLEEAMESAKTIISKFLEIPASEVEERVTLELKIQMPESSSLQDIDSVITAGGFVVGIYGSIKQGYGFPLGAK